MDEIVGILMGGFAIFALFIGLPWIILHYVSKWKSQTALTEPDEKLLEQLHDAARRLDDRICTIERIMSAEDPDWKRKCLPDDRGDERSLMGRADEVIARHDAMLQGKEPRR